MSSQIKTQIEESQLANRLVEKNRQIMHVNTQLQLKVKDFKYKELQVKELETTHFHSVYTAIGKIFLQSSKKDIIGHLKEQATGLEEEIQALSKKQAFYEKAAQKDQAQLKALLSKK